MNAPSPKSKILLPLYIYPHPGAWDPLFEAIVCHPALDFIVIVNPNSGPGSEPWWPNEDYVREIPKLNAYPNVQTVGYVNTIYCKRPIEKVIGDVDRYATWSKDTRFPTLGVSGIFFDETPNVFSEEAKVYLDVITKKVKETEGILGGKTAIHNPGTTIDIKLAVTGLDIATVAEMAYSDFLSVEYQSWLARSPLDRELTSYMIYGVPDELIEEFVKHTLRSMAGYLFVTDRGTDMYHGFGTSWKKFVAAMVT